MTLKHNYTATGTNDTGKQVSKDRWNEGHVIDSDGIDIPSGTTPSAPAAGNVRVFNKSQAGRQMLAMMGPSGLDTVLQPHLAKNGWSSWKPAGNGTTISAIGCAALSATGTATAANYAATSLHTRTTRVDYLVTTAATTAVAGFRAASADMKYRGTDGYHMVFRAAPATGVSGVSTRRFFCGMSTNSSAPTDVNPSSLTNIAGVGYDAADTNWQVMFNDASGTATKVDTGITRPSADRTGPYTVIVYSPPGGSYIGVRITDESSGTSYETTSTTDLISTTTACGPRGYASVGGTSSVVGITLFSGYVDSDN